MSSLRELVQAATRLQAVWDAAGLEYCFIGGLAVQHWGEPRQTGAVDATVWTEFGKERPVIDQLLETLSPRIADARGFAMVNRVLLAREPGGVDTDISLAAFPFEREVIDRARPITVHPEEAAIKLCDASDLMTLKAFANRPRDWQDIRGIMIRSAARLEWTRIVESTTLLATLKEEPEIVERLDRLRKEVST